MSYSSEDSENDRLPNIQLEGTPFSNHVRDPSDTFSPFSLGHAAHTLIINSHLTRSPSPSSLVEVSVSRSIDRPGDASKHPRGTFSSGVGSTLQADSNMIYADTNESEVPESTAAARKIGRRSSHNFVSSGRDTTVPHSTFWEIGANSQVFISSAHNSVDVRNPPIRVFHAGSDAKITTTIAHSLQTVIEMIMQDNDDEKLPMKDGDETQPIKDNDDKKLPMKDKDNKDNMKVVDSLRVSLDGYMEFSNYIIESRLSERTESLQTRGICLVIVAGVVCMTFICFYVV